MKFYHSFICLAILYSSTLIGMDNYEEGLRLYNEDRYTEAKSRLEKSAETGNHIAQYTLGSMYENGIGTDQNITKAMQFYKQAAFEYHPLQVDSNHSLKQNQLYQIDPESDKVMANFVSQYLDIPKDIDERETMLSKIFSNFGMLPYEKTFLIPIAYTSENFEKRDPTVYPGYNEFSSNIETEFQISLKKNLTYDLLGLNEILGFGYTQEVWWQFYSESAPFRETNYRPEVWLFIPVEDYSFSQFGLKAMKIAFWHESNGLGKPLSREWNQLYLDSIFYHGNLITTLRLWYPDEGEDNKDITSYLGYGHLKLSYIWGKQQFDLTWRNNLNLNNDNRGSIEGEWSYPIGKSKNNFWYLKAFSGYGASLMDYNHHQNRFGFGFLFSR